MLGPELAERFFQLLDPFGRPDPRLVPRGRSRLPLSAEALRNAERGQPTFETRRVRPGSEKSFRLLTLPVVRNGATVNIVQVAMSLENVEATRTTVSARSSYPGARGFDCLGVGRMVSCAPGSQPGGCDGGGSPAD